MNKIKVKKSLAGHFKNNKLTSILALTVASIFLLIFLKAWLNDDTEALDNLKETLGLNTDSSVEAPGVIYDPGAPKRLSVEEAKLKIKLGNKEARRFMSGYQTHRIEQRRLLKEFQNRIHLKMNFPGHLHYTPVDLEDDIGAIMGTTTNLDQTFAVLATSRQVTIEDVLGYLKDETEVFPMLQGHDFQPEKAFNFNPPESSGLGPLTIIPSSTHQGRDLYAVFAPRADKKGNYLFMMEANKSYFEANEDGFELLLDGMQATP